MTTPKPIEESRDQAVHRVRLDMLNLKADIEKNPEAYEHYKDVLIEMEYTAFNARCAIMMRAKDDNC